MGGCGRVEVVRRGVVALVLLAMSAGCDSPPMLVLDVRTDFVPGVEFHGAQMVVDGMAPEYSAIEGVPAEFLAGAHVGEFTDLELGPHEIRVRLIRGTSIVAERLIVVDLSEPMVVTAVFTRSCAGASCPDGGDPAATECVGGRCVAPACTPETPSACPPAACATAAECAGVQPCSEAICAGGVCLSGDAGGCATGEFCHPDRGCALAGSEGCPPFMASVEDRFCVDVYQSGTATWVDAMAFCEARGGSLCTEDEWVAACQTSIDRVDGLVDDWEWTSLLVDADNALKHGAGDCVTTSPHTITIDEYGVRCCLPYGG